MLPEYAERLAEIEKKKEARVASIKSQYQNTVDFYKEIFNASVTRSETTFRVRLISVRYGL